MGWAAGMRALNAVGTDRGLSRSQVRPRSKPHSHQEQENDDDDRRRCPAAAAPVGRGRSCAGAHRGAVGGAGSCWPDHLYRLAIKPEQARADDLRGFDGFCPPLGGPRNRKTGRGCRLSGLLLREHLRKARAVLPGSTSEHGC